MGLEEYNNEMIETNFGELEEIKSYCSSRTCIGKSKYTMPSEVNKHSICKSYRDGRCMMLEYMKYMNELGRS